MLRTPRKRRCHVDVRGWYSRLPRPGLDALAVRGGTRLRPDGRDRMLRHGYRQGAGPAAGVRRQRIPGVSLCFRLRGVALPIRLQHVPDLLADLGMPGGDDLCPHRAGGERRRVLQELTLQRSGGPNGVPSPHDKATREGRRVAHVFRRDGSASFLPLRRGHAARLRRCGGPRAPPRQGQRAVAAHHARRAVPAPHRGDPGALPVPDRVDLAPAAHRQGRGRDPGQIPGRVRRARRVPGPTARGAGLRRGAARGRHLEEQGGSAA